MFTDFLIFKILIVIFVLAVLLISFYFTLIFTLKAFKKEPQKVDHDDDDFDYHYDQLEDHKKLEQKILCSTNRT